MFYLGECEATHMRLARLELPHARALRTVEATMHGTLDRSGKRQNETDRSWSFGFFALPVILVILMVGLAMTKPVAFNWISEAAQAEFVGTSLPETAPTQLAQPAGDNHAVKAN
jgi:hypothetical protein